MWVKLRIPVAPSTLAASQMSCGIDIRPASRITVQNGNHFQICEQMAVPSASQRSLSQDGPSTPNRLYSALLSRPHSPFSIQWIEMNVGSAGTAQGRTKISSSNFVHQPGYMKKPDSISAKNNLRFTPKARNSNVLTTVR